MIKMNFICYFRLTCRLLWVLHREAIMLDCCLKHFSLDHKYFIDATISKTKPLTVVEYPKLALQ